MTTWQISEPTWQEAPAQACGIGNLPGYKRYRMDHGVSPKLSDKRATSQTAAFDHRVVAFLESRGWSRMDIGPNDGGIPNLKRCYKKQDAVVQIYETTARCTMNTPCRAYDGFAVSFYLPQAK
ncbi:MAG: hypothetical protein JO033_16070 [Acidobacteriaceae bacterium]|nr:hypothetical protein [Acidobacteriaceae bacterium]